MVGSFFGPTKARPASTAFFFFGRHGFSRGVLEVTKISHDFHDVFPNFFCFAVFCVASILFFFGKVQKKTKAKFHGNWGRANVFTFNGVLTAAAAANLDALV